MNQNPVRSSAFRRPRKRGTPNFQVRLLLQRLHVVHQRFGLFCGHTFLFISRHVGWLLGLLAFKHCLNQVIIGFGLVDFLFRRSAVAHLAFAGISRGRVFGTGVSRRCGNQ
jgi:hypothetical protein